MQLVDLINDMQDSGGVWDVKRVHQLLLDKGEEHSLRSTERLVEAAVELPRALDWHELQDEDQRPLKTSVVNQLKSDAKRKRQPSVVLQVQAWDVGGVVSVNDGRLGRQWVYLSSLPERTEDRLDTLIGALEQLVQDKPALLWPQGEALVICRYWAARHGTHELSLSNGFKVRLALPAFQEPKARAGAGVLSSRVHTTNDDVPQASQVVSDTLSHLDRLEAESIHIMREVVAQAENPVMLYSVGKDSSVMLHLARKAFYPSPPPFPLMHVDTRWKFQAMYDFRDYMAKESGMDLIVHINPEGVDKNINPFDHGSAIHTDVMKTQGLKQALDAHRFDVAFGGARRDEEKSRAKERIFSFRNPAHRWDPKNQRPELWRLYNGQKNPGESIRVFPLSNWTELDIWQYIYREQIPIVPLYFAAERPVVEKDGMLVMVDDDRLPIRVDETIQMKRVRFRTLGCYPLTGAVESSADDLSSIVLELLNSRTSERQGRAIDSDSSGSMEKKKQEGYF
jgi:sulfate adenylyltransferase subunit 2